VPALVPLRARGAGMTRDVLMAMGETPAAGLAVVEHFDSEEQAERFAARLANLPGHEVTRHAECPCAVVVTRKSRSGRERAWFLRVDRMADAVRRHKRCEVTR
jgi:hypothetical protein